VIINQAAQVRVELVAGSIPVLFVEDFYADPMEVREQAISAAYDRTVALYPGRHAPLETPEAKAVVKHVCELLSLIGDRIFEAETAITDFSVLTTKASDLIGAQKHPHIDPTPVLGLVYLNPHLTQGTCFYYNRRLGTHTIVGDEQSAALADFLAAEGPTYEPETYSLEGNAIWEKIYTIEGKFNRLVVYPGNVFHSIDLVDVAGEFDMNTARLTQRIIVQNTHPK
jgi:hypothetical protein